MNVTKERISRRKELQEVVAAFRQKSAEDRAVIMLHAWFDLVETKSCESGTVPDELKQSFFKWLDDPHERQAKEQALQRIVDLEKQVLTEQPENKGATSSI